jgi:hypothetical protein
MSIVGPRGEWKIEREEWVEMPCRSLVAGGGEWIDVTRCEDAFHRCSERGLSLRA